MIDQHVSLLRAFWRRTRTGEGPVPLLAHEAARRANLDDVAARGALEALRQAGYVEATRAGSGDNRCVYSLTDRGIGLMVRWAGRQVAA